MLCIVRDVGDAVRTQRSGGKPEYEPIRAACNRLAQLSTFTYLLQTRCESDARPSLTVCAAPRLVYRARPSSSALAIHAREEGSRKGHN